MNGPHFISFEEAVDSVHRHSRRLPATELPLAQAVGSILAESVVAPLDLPPFDNSAMDGYALRLLDNPTAPYRVIGEIPAGKDLDITLQPGECVRIFTGAPIPSGADTVVQQEWTERAEAMMSIVSGDLQKGANIRRRGSHVNLGETVMQPGYLLTPGAIGFLASMGIDRVSVYRRPRVAILITGSELMPPGTTLQPGQIYESNGQCLEAALTESGIKSILLLQVPDDLQAFSQAFEAAEKEADLILVSGGISVGDHDIARLYFEARALETLFYKVRQRPGKPLFFGRTPQALVFGLPGNPASILTSFYQYVWPVLRIMGGYQHTVLPRMQMPLAADFTKRSGLTFFLKGKIMGEKVMPLDGQLSHIMRSYAEADCLILLDEAGSDYKENQVVTVQLLPHGQY
jgi:molybdopterin molybdotransferase